jgi:hypothetical protein
MSTKETPQQQPLDDAQQEQVSSATGNAPDAAVLSDKDLDKVSGGTRFAMAGSSIERQAAPTGTGGNDQQDAPLPFDRGA